MRWKKRQHCKIRCFRECVITFLQKISVVRGIECGKEGFLNMKFGCDQSVGKVEGLFTFRARRTQYILSFVSRAHCTHELGFRFTDELCFIWISLSTLWSVTKLPLFLILRSSDSCVPLLLRPHFPIYSILNRVTYLQHISTATTTTFVTIAHDNNRNIIIRKY